jgi:hypothetical protein
MIVIEITLRVYSLRKQRTIPLTGPVAGFFLLGGWLWCYHFMYYDSLISALGVFVILSHPKEFLTPKPFTLTSASGCPPGLTEKNSPGHSVTIYFNSTVLTGVFLLVLVENLFNGLDLRATFVPAFFAPKGASNPADPSSPALMVSSGQIYPWETFIVIVLWMWCGWQTLKKG